MGLLIGILVLALIGNAMASPADKEWSRQWVKKNLEPWAIGFLIFLAIWFVVAEMTYKK